MLRPSRSSVSEQNNSVISPSLILILPSFATLPIKDLPKLPRSSLCCGMTSVPIGFMVAKLVLDHSGGCIFVCAK